MCYNKDTNDEGVVDMRKLKCNRCDGMGVLPHLKHVEGGRCFGCGGLGYILKDENEKPKKRNIYEYILFLDDNAEPIAVRKLEKAVSAKKAIELIDTVSDSIIYRYSNICTEEDLKKANLIWCVLPLILKCWKIF